MKPTLIWDWNGTLLDDSAAAVGALNHLLADRGLPAISRTFYRDHFGFPVRPFYATVGIDLAHDDWDGICRDFHRYIEAEPQALRAESLPALARAQAAGFRQAILSALREDLLRTATDAYGVAPYMAAVYGVDNLDGATKLARGRELITHLALPAPNGQPTPGLFFIGDTLHDAEVAAALGAQCILVTGGHQSATRLAAAGVPCVASPSEAVACAAERLAQAG